MLDYKSPKLILLITTLPVAVLFFLVYSQFLIIEPLLDEENKVQIYRFATWLGVLFIVSTFYSTGSIILKKKSNIWYAASALLAYVWFLVSYVKNMDSLFPWDIPNWMMDNYITIYPATFIMPTLIHAIYLIAIRSLNSKGESSRTRQAWVNLANALLTGLSFYIIFMVLIPWTSGLDYVFTEHIVTITLTTTTVLVIFFLLKSLMALLSRIKTKENPYIQLFWKIPFGIVLPIIGLLVNNGDQLIYRGGVFGDFSHPIFYILAAVNGIVLCFPPAKTTGLKLLSLIGKALLFPFTFYFFLVFLPFIPISLPLIIAIGIGALILTPIILFFIHVDAIKKDYQALIPVISRFKLNTTILACILILPGSILVNYSIQKRTLNDVLEYVFAPDLNKTYTIDSKNVAQLHKRIRAHKRRSNGLMATFGQPYLTAFHNWYVLDNLTLSDKKLRQIEFVFLGETEADNTFPQNNEETAISLIQSTTIYDPSIKAFKSWIDLELTNTSEHSNWRQYQYSTVFKIPEGCWISDYYLYVGDRKEMGILAEQKTATWTFQNIVSTRRDPGLLKYLYNNHISFDVFPFSSGEVRQTGFELVHKEPFDFTIDNHTVALYPEETPFPIASDVITSNDITYIPSTVKAQLELVATESYPHFLIDVSKFNTIETPQEIIETFVKEQNISTSRAKVSLVGTQEEEYNYNEDWVSHWKSTKPDGGYFVERAMQKKLVPLVLNHEKSLPQFYLITNNFNVNYLNGIIPDLPGYLESTKTIYTINSNGAVEQFDLKNNSPTAIKVDSIPSAKQFVLAYQHNNTPYFLLDNDMGSIIIHNDVIESPMMAETTKDWKAGLYMKGIYLSHLVRPNHTNKEWADLVKLSFQSHLMNPTSAFIALENEAQKKALLAKQKEVLKGNKILTPGEETESMSEPSFWIMLLLLGGLLYFHKRRNKHHVA